MKIHRLACSAAFAIAVAALGSHVSGQTATVACAVAPLQQKAPQGHHHHRSESDRGQRQPAALLPSRRPTATPGNEVNFRLGLPERWNGKYYFVGVGGLGGTIGRLDAGLARGYASASTDTGHDANDPTWGSNHAKEIDYGHRGTHVTAVAGKALTASFYGRAPEHAYFKGCSNGGRQALMEVQRYPTDFDGIIAGDPGDRHADAGGTRARVPEAAGVAGELPADRRRSNALEGHRSRRATPPTD